MSRRRDGRTNKLISPEPVSWRCIRLTRNNVANWQARTCAHSHFSALLTRTSPRLPSPLKVFCSFNIIMFS